MGVPAVSAALEILLGQPCYHMFEALAHLDHHPAWLAAADGDPSQLSAVLDDRGIRHDRNHENPVSFDRPSGRRACPSSAAGAGGGARR